MILYSVRNLHASLNGKHEENLFIQFINSGCAFVAGDRWQGES